METIDIRIGEKEYTVQVAHTELERVTGLSQVKELPEDEGMLFVFDKVQEEGYFTMKDTSIDLDIIFIDNTGEVISVHHVKAKDPNPVVEEDFLYVLEVNINSGITEGDEIEELDSEISDEDKQSFNSKMLILDENGNVQMKLEGGERIISIKDSKRLLTKVLTAFKSDKDDDYIKVGKSIFRILNAQDSRNPEYVEAPE